MKENHFKILLILIILLLQNLSFAQNKFKDVIIDDCQKMTKAVKEKKYEDNVDFIYPKIIKIYGINKHKLAKLSRDSYEKAENEGYVVQDIFFDEPEKIYFAGSELHCIIKRTTIMRTPKGDFSQVHYMLAISSNKGKNWYYLETHTLDQEKIEKIFPNFNYELKIPKKSALKKI